MTALAPRAFSTGYDPRSMRAALGLSRERMARLLDVSAKTIERWEAAGTPPATRHVRTLLDKVDQIVKLGLVVYTPEGLRTFMTSPIPELRGRTPLQAIEQDDADLVLGALAAEYEGLGY